MKFVRTTLAGGILFLTPLVIVALILEKALALVHKLIEPLAARLPVESIIGMRPAMLIAVVVLVLACFGAGMLARTRLARRIVEWLETNVLSMVPGYEFFKSIGESILGVESETTQQQAVLAHLDDAWQLGFLIERLDNGLLAIFVPDAPNPHSGSVVFMTAEKVVLVENAPPAAVQKCLKRLGAGSNAMLGKIAGLR